MNPSNTPPNTPSPIPSHIPESSTERGSRRFREIFEAQRHQQARARKRAAFGGLIAITAGLACLGSENPVSDGYRLANSAIAAVQNVGLPDFGGDTCQEAPQSPKAAAAKKRKTSSEKGRPDRTRARTGSQPVRTATSPTQNNPLSINSCNTLEALGDANLKATVRALRAADRENPVSRSSKRVPTQRIVRGQVIAPQPKPKPEPEPTPAPAPVVAPAPAPAPSGGIMAIAASLAGVPYRYGGTTTSGFDCSGYTQYVFARAGKYLPRTSSQQAAATARISASQAVPGDLVFFTGSGGVYHVGIYAGGGTIWHSPRPGGVVRQEAIWTSSVFYGRVR